MDYIERELGDIPISIGTSLALQGLINEHPDNRNNPGELAQITRVMVNVDTLVRNFLSSIPSQGIENINFEEAVTYLKNDVEVIQEFFVSQFKGRVRLTFYYQYTHNLKWLFPHAEFKRPTSDKQRLVFQIHRMLLDSLMAVLTEADPMTPSDPLPKRITGERNFELFVCENKLPMFSDNVAMITHYPHQLLKRFDYNALWLLESHTGRLKGFHQFYTKLKTLKDDKLPFNAFTLQLFGDGQVFSSFGIKIKREVLALAKQARWTISTSNEKISSDIKKNGSDDLIDTYQKLTLRIK